MNGGPFVATTNCSKDLVSQPYQIGFQVAENQGRGKVSRERLMTVQQMLGVLAHYHINRIEQSLQVTVLIKWCPQIRHNHVPHEHHFFVGKINQHGIVRFTASSRNQLEVRSADVQVRSIVDRNIRFVALNVRGAESVSEELLGKDFRCVEFFLELFLIVSSSIKLRRRV